MAANGQRAGSKSSSLFDTGFALRLVLAMVATAVAIPLICTIIGVPVGLALIAAGCKPLKNYMTERSNRQAADLYQRQLRQRRKKP
jgi:uncharacterized membrane protein YccF (DUF307 family)